MKRVFHLVISVILITSSIAARGQVFRGATYDELVRPVQQMVRAHNEMMNAINSLTSYVVDVLGHDIDAQLRKEMNAELTSLDNLGKQLTSYGYSAAIVDNYNSIFRRIQREIADYNNRIAEIRERTVREEAERAARLAAEPENWSGTGFALKDGYIATNFHVVDRAQRILVHGINGDMTTGFAASVIGVDKVNDLAIIKITDSRFTGFGLVPYAINKQMTDVGEDVWVLGYPLTQVLGNEIKLTTGVVSSRSGYQGDVSTYQISAPVQPGNSGGPLFDSNGNIAGIVNAGIPGAENVGYAIKTSYLQNLAESYSLSAYLPQNNTITSLALKEQVKRVKDYVFFLVCSSNSVLGKAQEGPSSKSTSAGSTTPSTPIDRAKDYYSRAVQLETEGKHDQAFQLIQQAIDEYPTTESHYARAILAYEYVHDYSIAIESAKYCLDNNFNTQQCLGILGDSYFELKRYDDSIEVWDKMISQNRKDVSALVSRGRCYREKGELDRALKDLNSALQLEGFVDGNFAPVYNEAAYIYMAQKDFAKAEEHLRKALKLERRDGYYYDSFGELMYKKGDYKECLRYMGIAICQGRKTKKGDLWLLNSFYYRGLANKALGYDSDAIDDLKNAIKLKKEEAQKELDELLKTNNQKSGKFFNLYRNPPTGRKKSSILTLKSIESTEESTILSFSYSGIGKQGFCSISPDTYIIEKESKTKLYLVDASGISISPGKKRYQNAEFSFTLIFPSISETCTEIDLIEENDNDNEHFDIIGINLKDKPASSRQRTNTVVDNSWQTIPITTDPQDIKGLTPYARITSKKNKNDRESCIKEIKQEAAKLGCNLVFIVHDWQYDKNITADLYKRP